MLPRKLTYQGLLLVGIPAVAQLGFLAVVFYLWNQPGATQLQQKVIVGAATFYLLLSATLFILFLETIVADVRRLLSNVDSLTQGEQASDEPFRSEELAAADKTFREVKSALQLALVAAHEGKEHKLAEQKLRLSEERIRLIVHSIPVGLFVIDRDGTVESANPAAQGMFFGSHKSLIGCRFQELFLEARDKTAKEFLDSLDVGAGSKPIELTGIKSSTNEFFAEVSLQPFATLEGLRYIALVVDVSERHEMERLKQEFVAIVSHELRTPLSSVGAFLDMISFGAFDADLDSLRTRSEVASRNVTRLIGLINNLLDLEKMEAGKFEFRTRAVPATELIQRSQEAILEFAENHSVKLVARPNDQPVVADDERICQVLINLLSNAIKFSPPGETVEIGTTDGGEWLEISVRDNGPGIPAGSEHLIFEKYRQANQPGEGRHRGTGLGLPICKQIIEQHGGTIGVERCEKKGSRFWFRLPKAKDAVEAPIA